MSHHIPYYKPIRAYQENTLGTHATSWSKSTAAVIAREENNFRRGEFVRP